MAALTRTLSRGGRATRGRVDASDVLLAAAAVLIGWALWDVGVVWVKVWAGLCAGAVGILLPYKVKATKGPES